MVRAAGRSCERRAGAGGARERAPDYCRARLAGRMDRYTSREGDFDDDNFGANFNNPLAVRPLEVSPDGAFDVEGRSTSSAETGGSDQPLKRTADPKNVDDWGRLSLGAVKTGEVDELIVNWCRNACASTWLDALILFCIIANTALLAAAGPATTLDDEVLARMVVADLVLTVVFTAEMVIRIVALGFWDRKGTDPAPRYLNNAWNKMDFFVVVSSWLNIVVEATGLQLGIDMNSLRALRIMRVLKAFKSIEGIRVILATIAAAIPHTVNGALLASLFNS